VQASRMFHGHVLVTPHSIPLSETKSECSVQCSGNFHCHKTMTSPLAPLKRQAGGKSLHGVMQCLTATKIKNNMHKLTQNSVPCVYTDCLLNSFSLGRNICSGIAKQMEGSVRMFDLLYYVKLLLYLYNFLCFLLAFFISFTITIMSMF